LDKKVIPLCKLSGVRLRSSSDVQFSSQCVSVSHTQCSYTEILNGDVTLTPAIRDTCEEILWKHNNDKVIELVRGQGIREFGKLRGRTTLNQETGELRVRNLEKRHSGRYTYFTEGEMGQYRWEGPNDFLMSWTEQPIGLEISRDQSSDSAYTCVVKNPVSEKSSLIYCSTMSPFSGPTHPAQDLSDRGRVLCKGGYVHHRAARLTRSCVLRVTEIQINLRNMSLSCGWNPA
uniref:Uncharacterized protein n=1 Tax=Scleropages formosus TaxID=113540 RepID=A0A8C9SWN0_SCLFO